MHPKTVYRGGCVDECAEYLERSPSANLGRLVPRSEGRAIALTLFVGLDVSVKEMAVAVARIPAMPVCAEGTDPQPDDIVSLVASIGEDYGGIGIEAGPLSQRLVNGLTAAGGPVVCVETRHMMALLKALQINKIDRDDIRPDQALMQSRPARRNPSAPNFDPFGSPSVALTQCWCNRAAVSAATGECPSAVVFQHVSTAGSGASGSIASSGEARRTGALG
jgi:hypothetical protein